MWENPLKQGLLPSTWLPARVLPAITSGLGALLLIAGMATGGGMAIIPGLFLLGFAIGYTDFVRTALAHPGRLALRSLIATCATHVRAANALAGGSCSAGGCRRGRALRRQRAAAGMPGSVFFGPPYLRAARPQHRTTQLCTWALGCPVAG